MFTLGINLSHHSSIALLKDNEVLLFIHEERLNRDKYHRGLPYRSLDLIKNYTNNIDSVIQVSGSTDNLKAIVKYLADQNVDITTFRNDGSLHHMSHAAAGFFMSHFDTATVVVIDGAGALYRLNKSNVRISETTSLYDARFPQIVCTDKHFVIGLYDKKPLVYTDDDKKAFRAKFKNSRVSITEALDIGWKYAEVTSSIGFGTFGEGKTMGLSAYGHKPTTDQNVNKAYNIQKELEAVFVHLASKIKTDNVVLSGGCALNILGNSLIKKTYSNLNVFVDPIAADGTVALGAAAYEYYSKTKDINKLVFGLYQGPQYQLEKNYIYECARKYSV
jgi:carbamoyltransferase